MKRTMILLLLFLATLSSAGQNGTEDICIPIIKYNPATFLSDLECALADPESCECLSADSRQFSRVGKDILAYLSGQDAFIVSLKDGDTEPALKFIGIRDKERGYLKYLDLEENRYRYSLHHLIIDMYGSLEDYIATWPEDQRHLFYDDPQGLYTFPIQLFAVNVAGYENSKNPDNPARFKAAISYLRTTRPEWNDDTWADDSTEIVEYSDLHTGILVHYTEEKAGFEGQDANYFSKWVRERLTYPDAALEDAATGRVTLRFTINMFGSLEDVKVLRGRHPALDSIAINIVSSSPKWTPGKDLNGIPFHRCKCHCTGCKECRSYFLDSTTSGMK